MWLQWEEGKQMKASVSIEHPFFEAYMTKMVGCCKELNLLRSDRSTWIESLKCFINSTTACHYVRSSVTRLTFATVLGWSVMLYYFDRAHAGPSRLEYLHRA